MLPSPLLDDAHELRRFVAVSLALAFAFAFGEAAASISSPQRLDDLVPGEFGMCSPMLSLSPPRSRSRRCGTRAGTYACCAVRSRAACWPSPNRPLPLEAEVWPSVTIQIPYSAELRGRLIRRPSTPRAKRLAAYVRERARVARARQRGRLLYFARNDLEGARGRSPQGASCSGRPSRSSYWRAWRTTKSSKSGFVARPLPGPGVPGHRACGTVPQGEQSELHPSSRRPPGRRRDALRSPRAFPRNGPRGRLRARTLARGACRSATIIVQLDKDSVMPPT